MNGIVLFSGINYSGKSTVLGIVKEDFVGARFETLSRLMMERSKVDGHIGLSHVDPQTRNSIRRSVLTDISDESKRQAIFLDSHFVFEDGEKSDFSIISRDVKSVVLIKPDPENILSRALNDDKISLHPGRSSLKDLGFIKSYLDEEEKTAKEYIDISYETTGQRIDFVVVRNNIVGLDNLRKEISLVTPIIKKSLLDRFTY